MRKKILPVFAFVSVIVAVLVLVLFNGEATSPKKDEFLAINKKQSPSEEFSLSEEIFHLSEDQTKVVVDTHKIGTRASFYTYPVGDVNVEFFVVRAGDGSIRLALNTCQVCHGSPKAFFVQVGSSFVCQNCGNSFNSLQIGNVAQGCSPMPIPLGAYSWNGDFIFVETAFLAQHADDFREIKK